MNDQSAAAAEGWQVGEVGGFEAYLLADEDEEGAAAVYRQVTVAKQICFVFCMSDAACMISSSSVLWGCVAEDRSSRGLASE